MDYKGVGVAGASASTADKTAADYYFDSYAKGEWGKREGGRGGGRRRRRRRGADGGG